MLGFGPISSTPLSSLGETAALVTAAVGTFTLTGQDAVLKVNPIRLPADAGSFVVTGNAVNFVSALTLAGERGSFSLDGQNASGVRVGVSARGTFTLTGQAALFVKGPIMPSAAGSFVLTGNVIGMTADIRVPQVGQYAVNTLISPTNFRMPQVTGPSLSASSLSPVVASSPMAGGMAAPAGLPMGGASAGATAMATAQINANTIRTNDNIVGKALTEHDADQVIHVQSAPFARRPPAGTEGRTWWTTDTGNIRLWYDTGSAWEEVAYAKRYGAWSDYTDQTTTAANTATLMTLNTTDVVSGTSLVSSSRMTVSYAGVYNFQWSGQFTNTDSAEQDVDIWIRINGTDVVGSAGRVSVPKRHGTTDGHVLPGWNYYLSLNANDYVQLYWAASNTSVSLQTVAAASPVPSTASLIATMEKVS